MSIDFKILRQLVDSRLADPNFCPILLDARSQATYFMIAGHLAAKQTYGRTHDSFKATADISFGVPIPRTPILSEELIGKPATDAALAEIHLRTMRSFRVGISRNKKKLEDAGQVIANFKALHKSYTLVAYPDPAYQVTPVFVETFTYSYNPLLAEMVADMLEVAGSL